jgi:hypothetical protein
MKIQVNYYLLFFFKIFYWNILIDIAVSVINLLQELTDAESSDESIEGAKLLVDALVRFGNHN